MDRNGELAENLTWIKDSRSRNDKGYIERNVPPNILSLSYGDRRNLLFRRRYSDAKEDKDEFTPFAPWP